MNAPPDFSASRPAEELFKARVAVSIAFLLLGVGVGLWAVHIPIVQARLGIDNAVLGFALLSMAIGAVALMPLTGWAVARLGSRLPTAFLTMAFTALIPLPILAGSTVFLFVALFLLGAAMGGLDVAVNTQASEVETLRGRPTMSFFHGFYSVGGLVGAMIGALVIGEGWGNGEGATVFTIVFLAIAAMSVGNLLPSSGPVRAGLHFVLPNRAVLGLGMLAFLSFAMEGAIHDWSTLFLTSEKGASPAAAASGFALYSLAMASCRLFGDPVVARLGARLTLALGGGLFALGIAIAVLSPWALASAAGFLLCGVGAANIVPVVFSQSARVPGVAPSVGVAAATTLGYSGFLIAPPILGLIANDYDLSTALVLVALMGLVITMAAVFRR